MAEATIHKNSEVGTQALKPALPEIQIDHADVMDVPMDSSVAELVY